MANRWKQAAHRLGRIIGFKSKAVRESEDRLRGRSHVADENAEAGNHYLRSEGGVRDDPPGRR